MSGDPVVEAYSRFADRYDAPENRDSCWGRSSRALWSLLSPGPDDRVVVDVGCGAGGTLAHLAERLEAGVRLVGIEPADGLRARAAQSLRRRPVELRDGRFELLPLPDGVVDYLYSIMAFHWVADPEAAAREVGRALHPRGRADLFFAGRRTGRGFIRATTPTFLRHMGPSALLAAARLRQQLTADTAAELFRQQVPGRAIEVREWEETHHDTLAGHWAWWVRIEAQLLVVPPERRERCEREVRAALSALATPDGIPYDIHIVHVRVGP